MTQTDANYWTDGKPTFQTDLPCPKCGVRMVLGYYFLTPDEGKHQHTHYVCLSWPYDASVYPEDAGRCGWHGWTVPDGEVDVEVAVEDAIETLRLYAPQRLA